MKRILQELLDYMGPLPSATYLSDLVLLDLPHDLQMSLSNVLTNARISTADLVRLYTYYRSPDARSHVDHLRHPVIFHCLLQDAFGKTPLETHVDERFFLLALASSFVDATIHDPQALIQTTVDSLKNLDSLLRRVFSMNQIQDHFLSFIEAIKTPITSMALITWFEHKLLQESFYDWSSLAAGVIPPVFYLLDEVFF
jgi:hypothetical protein